MPVASVRLDLPNLFKDLPDGRSKQMAEAPWYHTGFPSRIPTTSAEKSALHILRLLELLPCSQDTSGDYRVTYASSYIMTEVPSRSMKAIHLKGWPF